MSYRDTIIQVTYWTDDIMNQLVQVINTDFPT